MRATFLFNSFRFAPINRQKQHVVDVEVGWKRGYSHELAVKVVRLLSLPAWIYTPQNVSLDQLVFSLEAMLEATATVQPTKRVVIA